ncbi:phage tail tape measure protein [Kitasatospora sp. NBC_00240]|uniref:phage tail tape measure protein n=1 Tax=Kitasatospora sp. NBC_00240 TaxID=2903567 RepID=UPI00224C957B|nr:phage tail tape measure protein [Kitasatospora sp. NBC_00240]MCX5209821.1 phage tail tape measure protein [Kitasatospora sp. NBC_00240]
MSESFLPPVLVNLGADVAEFATAMTRSVAQLEEFAAAAQETSAVVAESFARMSAAALEMSAAVEEASTVAKTGLRQVASAARALDKAVLGMSETMPAAMGAVSGSAEEMAASADAAFVSIRESARLAAASVAEVGAASTGAAAATAAASTRSSVAAAEAGTAATATAAETEAAMGRVGATVSGATAGAAAALKKYTLGLGAAAFGAVETIHAASEFQGEMVRLRTSAGETGELLGGKLTGNLKLVSEGVLKMAIDTGTSTKELSEGLYKIESAGFHGAEGLRLLEVAAEGARAEGASLETVSNTLDSAMNSFGFDVDHVSGVMNAMVQTTAHGKASMEELSSALPVVMSKASAAGVSLQEMLGAMATMTAQGVTARQAAQNLQAAISHLSDQKEPARKAFASIGLDGQQLAKDLGKNGLTGTFDIVAEAIAKHTKDGMVLVETMNRSKQATEALKVMMEGMGPAAKTLSQGFLDGGVSLGDFNKAANSMPGLQGDLAKQFLALAKNSEGFSTMLKNGSGPSQTFIAEMSKMMGGSAGLNTYLELSGVHAQTFADNVDAIGKAAEDNSAHVEGFSEVQKTFGFHMSQLKETAATLGIAIGTMLIPYVEKFLGWVQRGATWVSSHKTAVQALAAVIGGVLVGSVIALGVAVAAAAGPEILIATAVIALAGAVVYAYKHFETFHRIVNAVGSYLATVFVNTWHLIGTVVHWFATTVMPLVKEAIHDVIDWFQAHKEVFRTAWEQVLHAVHAVVNWFNDNVLKWIRERVAEFVDWWGEHSHQIHQVWQFVWDYVKTIVQVWWDGYMKPVLSIIQGAWTVAWGIIKDTVKLAWDLISGVITTGIHYAENVIGLVLDIITLKWGKVWGDLRHLVSQAWDDITGYLGRVAGDFGSLLYDAGKNLINGLIKGIKSAAGGVKDAIGDIAGSVRSYWPFSPAKVGPLSGTGSLDIAGHNIGTMLATGMQRSAPLVTRASGGLAAAAAIGIGGAALAPAFAGAAPLAAGGRYAAGPPVVVNVTVQGSVLSERDLRTVLERQMYDLGAHNSQTWQPYRRQ